MILSIIIPAYNAEPYLNKLVDCLKPQLTKDTEVIVIDDGSKEPVKVPKGFKLIRQQNGGVSSARNAGLDIAKGEYITFIDADDLVADDYIENILGKIKEGCDYVYLSWKTIGNGWQANVILKSITDTFPPDNLCVWNRVYRRSMINDIRFNTNKLIAEDAEFIRLVETNGFKRGFIQKPIYFYRSDTPESLSKRFASGELNTKRVVYYFNRVTSDMTYLLDEFKKDDEISEVILMTNDCQIPELKKYAMVIAPRRIRATEKKGEPCNLITIVELPIKTQVVIWTNFSNTIGGIETFIYYFVKTMSKYYDIMVLYEHMSDLQISRVARYAECRKNNPNRIIECDCLIVNRIVDTIPKNVHPKKTIQMVHGAKITYAAVPQDKDVTICVSEYVKNSWGDKTENAKVIHNILAPDKPKTKPLLMVTASRLDAKDKGFNRMQKLGKLMDSKGIPYIWLCFSNVGNSSNLPSGMVLMKPTLDITTWVKCADYLVQLSDTEAFCYSLVEALSINTPVITTPMEVLDEIGVKDGKNGYVVPFNIPDDFDVTKFLQVPTFKYTFDNQQIINQWRAVLGDMKPTHSYKPNKTMSIVITKPYYDIELKRQMSSGETLNVIQSRAKTIISKGYAKRKE